MLNTINIVVNPYHQVSNAKVTPRLHINGTSDIRAIRNISLKVGLVSISFSSVLFFANNILHTAKMRRKTQIDASSIYTAKKLSSISA